MRLPLVLATVLALMLSACATPSGSTVAASSDVGTAEEASCAAAGGVMKPLGRLQRVQCVVPYADAGKTCSNKTDCSGQCLGSQEATVGSAATGMCQRDISENFGCRQRIDGGVAQGTICVD